MTPTLTDHTATRAVLDVEDRVVIVTGASSGLGHHFAQMLHAHGARVIAVARRRKRLEQLRSLCPEMHIIEADLTSSQDRDALVRESLDAHGRIDALVNNAGRMMSAAASDEDMDDVRALLELNVVALMDLARQVAPSMRDGGGGSIVNITSIAGLVSQSPIPAAGYCASKGAVISVTRDLACQWARWGIRVNALAPGFFPTEGAHLADDEHFEAWMRRNCPMGRHGDLEELDGPLLLLVSGASTYLTGQVLAVDGGWTAR